MWRTVRIEQVSKKQKEGFFVGVPVRGQRRDFSGRISVVNGFRSIDDVDDLRD